MFRGLLVGSLLLLSTIARAQVQPPAQTPAAPPSAANEPHTFTLVEALRYAGDHYPAIRAAGEQVEASSADVRLARAAYLPRLDALWQSNRATANNTFGQLLPQSVVPPISGPVLPSAIGQSVWGSAAGALFSWEAVDFGRRGAGVEGARSALAGAQAEAALTRLEVETAAGGAFLDALGAERAVTAAQADFSRRDTLARQIHALVDHQLRPGADASRADAERAAAQTRLLQAQAAVSIAQAVLARRLGVNGPIAIAAGQLLDDFPASTNTVAPPPGAHPLAGVRQATVEAAQARERALARTDLPRLFVQASVSGRGSGASPDGTLSGALNGLGLDRANWAAGVQVVFPDLFDFASLHARQAAAAASTRAARALNDEALLTVTSERQTAAATLQAARAIAANTPIELAAARAGEAQARARYQAGLATIAEVADAQGLLAQAEYEDQAARVNVWQAWLASAAAAGDLTPFINLFHP
jgi:outer membrane protein TolC